MEQGWLEREHSCPTQSHMPGSSWSSGRGIWPIRNHRASGLDEETVGEMQPANGSELWGCLPM